MHRQFPNSFLPDRFLGPRAHCCEDRRDLFQQLIGDAVKELAGESVKVSLTKGADGAIDVFVPYSVATTNLWGFPTPIILECKDHEARDHVLDKVKAGWRDVKKGLNEKAASGWDGLAKPWRDARSYVYIVSCDLSIEARLALEEDINKFFAELPTEQRPPITEVNVMGWSDLVRHLSKLSRVADRWLGIGPSYLLSHEDYIGGLERFLQYLNPATLPFLPPLTEAAWHPDTIWSRLSGEVDRQGILLSGPGGIGKTRLLLEVAQRAYDNGWRVLHLTSRGPTVDREELREVILQNSWPTLLVVDYWEQIALDLDFLRFDLLTTANLRGQMVRLLASSRPAFTTAKSPDFDLIFQDISIDPSEEERQRVALHLQRVAAPRAIELLGSERVAELCGQRPAIALLISLHLEERVRTGGPSSVSTIQATELRREKLLTYWLTTRLDRDELNLAQRKSYWEPNEAQGPLISAATILALTPQPEEDLGKVARGLLSTGFHNYDDV